MAEEIAYQHGQLIPARELAISVSDPGFVLGITVSERLRTFAGRLFRWDEHWSRLCRSLEILGVSCRESADQIKSICHQIVDTNYAQLAAGHDLGLVILCAPSSMTSDDADLRAYTYPLPFANWSALYGQGQRLVISSVAQVPGRCWPAELKCRSRMHYYLADREARQRDVTSRAILLDINGFVTEASTANLVLHTKDDGLNSPPLEKIIPGISLQILSELAERLGLGFHYRDLRPEDLLTADEVMLCSTSPCLIPVSTIDGALINGGEPGEVFRRLITAWSEEVDLDIIAQAEARG